MRLQTAITGSNPVVASLNLNLKRPIQIAVVGFIGLFHGHFAIASCRFGHSWADDELNAPLEVSQNKQAAGVRTLLPEFGDARASELVAEELDRPDPKLAWLARQLLRDLSAVHAVSPLLRLIVDGIQGRRAHHARYRVRYS